MKKRILKNKMRRDAKKLKIKTLSVSSVEIPNHPINDMGKRKIEITEDFYISGDDAESIREQSTIRLLGLGNVKITKIGTEFEGEFEGEGNSSNILKIQWVPQETAHEIKMIIPKILFNDEEFNEDSLEELDVYTEPQYLQLKEGEEIQFVRFGYCRKDSQNQAIFTHK